MRRRPNRRILGLYTFAPNGRRLGCVNAPLAKGRSERGHRGQSSLAFDVFELRPGLLPLLVLLILEEHQHVAGAVLELSGHDDRVFVQPPLSHPFFEAGDQFAKFLLPLRLTSLLDTPMLRSLRISKTNSWISETGCQRPGRSASRWNSLRNCVCSPR